MDKQIHIEEAKEYELAHRSAKQHYYTNAVLECNGDQGSMFSIINTVYMGVLHLPSPQLIHHLT